MEAAIIPPITPVPRECLDADPAPELITIGKTPNANAKDVITIGRKRSLAAAIEASIIFLPFLCSVIANSTINIAFFAPSPISKINPIWK